jgi:glucose dehydrogenase
MTNVSRKNVTKELSTEIKKTLSNRSIRAIAIAVLFVISGVGASVLINPAAAAPNAAAPSAAAPSGAAPVAAATPLTAAEANWQYPNGNAFGYDYNPQNQINSSNIQYLGISWVYPIPSPPQSLTSVLTVSTPGVNIMPLIVNGTVFAMSNVNEVFAFNVANGDLLWTFQSPLAPNQTLGLGVGNVAVHAHDGNEQFTTATFGSGVSGPTFWFQAGNARVYALNAISGKEELNFTSFTGLSMVPGNSPTSTYPGNNPNISISQQLGILVTSRESGSSESTGRQFFAGWNLNTNPPSLKWISYDTPPQPGGNVPLNPYWAQQQIANMTGTASTFDPAKIGSTNGYTTPAEIAGGLMNNTNDNIVVNWKSLTPAQENASLYNDWGYSDQSAQCQAVTGGYSTGSVAAGWGAQWLIGTGPTAGMIIVNTNNKDPYVSPCEPGPDLWAASFMALNMTNGRIIWAFQSNAHDEWDFDCSWWQGLANETINGVNTQVILKTCKSGYVYEVNAATGHLYWAWGPPAGMATPGPYHCPVCWAWNPLNQTQMEFDWPAAMTNCAPTFTTACILGPQPPYFAFPSPSIASTESENAFDPATNQIYIATHNVPAYVEYVPNNASTYFIGDNGQKAIPCPTCGFIGNNATLFDLNAATGQLVWHYEPPASSPVGSTGFRGPIAVSGNLVYMTLSTGDILMVNAQTGTLVRDFYMGAPMDAGLSIGSSIAGQEFLMVPVGTCGAGAITTCPGSTPGDLIALTLSAAAGQTVTTTTTTTTTSLTTTTLPGQVTTTTVTGPGGAVITTTITGTATTITMSGSGTATTTTTTTTTTTSSGVSYTVLYGVAAVAVIFIIVSGYLAMRGRKPAS